MPKRDRRNKYGSSGKSKKLKTQQPTSGDNEERNNNEPITGNIAISGAVQIFETERVIDEHVNELKKENAYKDATKEHEKSTRSISIWAIVISALYFVATCFIYLETRKSANAAKNAADIASRALIDSQAAFQLQNRPYVIVSGTPYFLRDAKNQAVRIDLANIRYKNVGKSPAQDVFGLGSFAKWGYAGEHTQQALISHVEDAFRPIMEDEAKIPSASNEISRTDFAPDAPEQFITRDLKDTGNVSPEELKELKDVKANLMLFYVGRIHYTGFGKTQSYTTEFCFFFFGPDVTTWHYCPTHNTIK